MNMHIHSIINQKIILVRDTISFVILSIIPSITEKKQTFLFEKTKNLMKLI